MLAAHPLGRTPRLPLRRSRAPLRIYAPPAEDCRLETPVQTATSRTGELQPIGQLMPQVLARYFAMDTEK